MVYSTRRFVVCLSVCHFVLVFFSPFSIAIASLGEEGANLSAFRTFVRFVLVWICRFPLPLGIWEGLRFVIVALPGLFSYLFFPALNVVQRYQNAEFVKFFKYDSRTIAATLSRLSNERLNELLKHYRSLTSVSKIYCHI